MRIISNQSRSTETRIAASLLVVTIAVLGAAPPATAQTVPDEQSGQAHSSDQSPILINTCLITANIKGLAQFYKAVLQSEPRWSGEDYVEFRTGIGVLAIFSARAQERYIPGSAIAANNKGIVLEFRVADVDQEYRRLKPLVKSWVKPPTTQPWGTRSVYFRDPDGNLIDFYMPSATP
jgi:catechol 2,3-dioxygenase-like lactoylglutathione lyase family enzyme